MGMGTREMCFEIYVNVQFQNKPEKNSIASFPLMLQLKVFFPRVSPLLTMDKVYTLLYCKRKFY
jgi:hypothetical protein